MPETAAETAGTDAGRVSGPASVGPPPTPDPIDHPPKTPHPGLSFVDEGELEEAARADERETRELARYVAPVAGLAFKGMSAWRGVHWELSPDETDTLSVAAAALLVKYAGVLAGRYAAELGFALAVMTILTPRIARDVELTRERRKEAARTPGNQKDDHPEGDAREKERVP